MQHAVIYAFRSPGSGAVYIGKHEPKPDVDPTAWPRRGTGRLPDRYKGSGDVVPRFHARHGDRVQWRILAIVPVADWPRAERRAVHLARLIFGRRCVNVVAGGLGMTSADARAFWADPSYAEKTRAAIVGARSDPVVAAKRLSGLAEAMADPTVQARRLAGLSAAMADPTVQARRRSAAAKANARPEVKARQSAATREAQNRPDAKAMRSAQGKARIQTPEGAAVLARAQAVAARKRRARRALAPFAVPPSISRPGVCLWAYLPPLRVFLSVSLQRANGRRKPLL